MSTNFFRRRSAPISLCALASILLSMTPARYAHAQNREEPAPPPADVKPAEVKEVAPKAEPSHPSLKASQAGGTDSVSADDVKQTVDKSAKPIEKAPNPSDAADASHLRSLPTGENKSGASAQAISVPKGPGTIQGMGESFSAQPSTGISNFSVPFALLKARGGVQPSLSLSYSSSGGNGIAGIGWDVSVPYISRQTDRGLPKYKDQATWHAEQDRFVFNGGQELVPVATTGLPEGEQMPVWANGWQYFRARIEGSYLRFFWNPTQQIWRVQDKSGSIMEFGTIAGDPDDGALEYDPANPSRVFRWNLKRQQDAHSNQVVYSYFRDGNLSYLQDIYDTPPVSGGNTYSQWAHHTRLKYDIRADISRGFNRGWETIKTKRLSTVTVAGKTGNAASSRQLVRRYRLVYDTQSHVSLLKSLEVDGTCNKALENQAGDVLATKCASLLPMIFGYTQVSKTEQATYVDGFEPFNTEILDLAKSPKHSVDEDYTDLYDINGDALPDVVAMMPWLYDHKHGLWLQGKGGIADSFGSQQPMCVSGVLGADEAIITKKNPNIAVLDLTADGKIDLLHMPKTKTYSVYTPKLSGSDWCWYGREVKTANNLDPRIDFGTDAKDLRVFDVNGDGMVDVVKTTGTSLQTWFALGRYPKGDGQFGSSSWATASSANFDLSPVQRCIPWSSQPIRFSDAEVKLGDMNGDGITDIVRVRKGDIKYWPGRGDGSFGTGSLACPSGSFSQDAFVQMDESPFFSATDPNELRLGDLNGDGTADVLHVRFHDASVWLNVDGKSWTSQRVLADTPPSSGLRSRVRVTDMNGSGTEDILWGDGLKYRYLDLAGGRRPWLLNHVENGLGKSTDITYTTSTAEMLKAAKNKPWNSVSPVVTHMVSSIVVRDNLDKIGRPAGEYRTEYEFQNPVYDGLQREFRGFRTTRVRTLGDENSPSSETETSFDLGERPTSYQLDSTPVDYVNPENAWMDNPREALKGLATVTESYALDSQGHPSTYISTSHTGYRLRRLYTGLDGRGVVVAFAEKNDNFFYDTGNFKSPATLPTYVATAVTHEDRLTGKKQSESRSLRVRATDGFVHTSTSSFVDNFGNKTEEIAYGEVGKDEEIHSFTRPSLESAPNLPFGEGHWAWRTKESYVVGSDGIQRKHSEATDYTDWGDPISSRAYLSGSVVLKRTFGAPAPPTAVSDGAIELGHVEYDSFGNTIFTAGPQNRCSTVAYDTDYRQFPIGETIYAGAPGLPITVGTYTAPACGVQPLSSHAGYDNTIQQVTWVADPNSAVTRIEYDDFGRMHTMTKPSLGGEDPVPSLIVGYELGNPVSRLVSKSQDGLTTSESRYHETHAVVDGLGRTIVAFSERDHAQDGYDWVVGGLTDYDQKGAVRRKYLPWSHNGAPSDFELSASATTPYGQQRYDAFGRVMETIGLDGTITLRTKYHALSADAWDAEDIAAGTHYGTYASETKDGHGRVVRTTERVRAQGGNLEERHTDMTYLATGEVTSISRKKGSDSWSRTVEYDSLGHMVQNHEPNSGTWLYAYDKVGALVGMSDARQCGANYFYDTAGRLVAEDYAPCETSQPGYTDTAEVTYQYDVVAPSDWDDAFPADTSVPSGNSLGKLVAVTDRASRSVTAFDARGRAIAAAKTVASPSGLPTNQWFRIHSTYDAGDRPLHETTGATVGITSPWDSKTMTEYTTGGTVKQVDSTYGMLVKNVKRSPDGKVNEIQYGDVATTTTAFTYDDLRRLRTLTTFRTKQTGWATPANAPVGFAQQMLLQDEEFTYDRVGNPTEIRDYRDPAEWPESAKPVNRKMKYDDLYRMSEIDYEYTGGSDTWTDVYAAEDAKLGTGPKASPRADLSTAGRPLKQTYQYDWRGNLVESDDNAHAFYDRSLGTQTHVATTDRLATASNTSKTGAHTGNLTTEYDVTGNLTGLTINRNGDCKPAVDDCKYQRYRYEWDEVGRLMRARRYDSNNTGSDPPAAELSFAYDSGNNRVRKTSGQNHTIYIFDSLELRSAHYDDASFSYEVTEATEVPFVFAHGVRLGRVVHKNGSPTKLYMELGDHLGSTSVVLDHDTGDLIERNTAYAYGAPESIYRSDVDPDFREDYRFTGKEDDIEVGLIYFGQRYYAPLLQRWISPDPLAVHAPGQADLNVYAYVHGKVMISVDPVGLQEAPSTKSGDYYPGAQAPAAQQQSIAPSSSGGDGEFASTFKANGNGEIARGIHDAQVRDQGSAGSLVAGSHDRRAEQSFRPPHTPSVFEVWAAAQAATYAHAAHSALASVFLVPTKVVESLSGRVADYTVTQQVTGALVAIQQLSETFGMVNGRANLPSSEPSAGPSFTPTGAEPTKDGVRFPINPNELFRPGAVGVTRTEEPNGNITWLTPCGADQYKIKYDFAPHADGKEHFDGPHYHVTRIVEVEHPGNIKKKRFRLLNSDPDTNAIFHGGTFGPGDLLPTSSSTK